MNDVSDVSDAAAHTGSAATRILGAIALVGIVIVAVLGLVVTPPDVNQGDAARLIYVHVPVAIVMNVAFFLTALGSGMWLWKKSRWWDTVAYSSAEVGVVFTALALGTGMLWGKPVWGVFWQWEDPRLTTTALLLALYLGYLLIRRLTEDPYRRASRAAVVGIFHDEDVKRQIADRTIEVSRFRA